MIFTSTAEGAGVNPELIIILGCCCLGQSSLREGEEEPSGGHHPEPFVPVELDLLAVNPLLPSKTACALTLGTDRS